MRTNKPLSVINYLSVGESEAITAKELAKLLRCNVRSITAEINALRKEGKIIVSGSTGFWLPANDFEIKKFVGQMKSRVREITAATQGAANYLNNKGLG